MAPDAVPYHYFNPYTCSTSLENLSLTGYIEAKRDRGKQCIDLSCKWLTEQGIMGDSKELQKIFWRAIMANVLN